MEGYRLERGSNAMTFPELTNGYILSPLDLEGYTFSFLSDGSQWSIAVPRQETLAGNYLLTSKGRIHFNAAKSATTNDVDLELR